MNNLNMTTADITYVFSLYIGQEIVHEEPKDYNNFSSAYRYDLKSVGINSGVNYSFPVNQCYLALTPHHKITDEDSIELAGYYGYDLSHPLASKSNLAGFGRDRAILEINSYDVRQFLIRKGYSVPLFFRMGEPLNGKTPIELNIAFDKTVNQ